METAFLGQAYSSRFPVLASQTAVNIYPELVETSGSDVGAFIGTPGRSALYTAPVIGEVRGLWNAEGTVFGVIGNTVYRFDANWLATSLGTLPNSTGKVSMADNGSQLAIAHASGMHWVALTGTSIAAVSGAPSGAIIAAQDNYLMFTESVGGEWGITALGDLSTIDPLDIATAEGAPDNLVSLFSDHREVWLFGQETTEVWANTGAAFFPFERAPGGFIEQGCAAKWSPAKIDNSVFWVGQDKAGNGVVFRSNGYTPVRISTHAIEMALTDCGTISDAIGYTYQEDGHSFYVLTFPTGDATWVYDASTGMWHRRADMDTYGVLHRDRVQSYCTYNGLNIVGDYSNGKISKSATTIYTDNGTAIYRERAWESSTDDHLKHRGDSMELVALCGDGDGAGGEPIVWLQVSQDAGQSWGYERQRTLGPIGQRKKRAKWRRLGSGRDTVWRVATTMSQRVCWVAGILKEDVYAT